MTTSNQNNSGERIVFVLLFTSVGTFSILHFFSWFMDFLFCSNGIKMREREREKRETDNKFSWIFPYYEVNEKSTFINWYFCNHTNDIIIFVRYEMIFT